MQYHRTERCLFRMSDAAHGGKMELIEGVLARFEDKGSIGCLVLGGW